MTHAWSHDFGLKATTQCWPEMSVCSPPPDARVLIGAIAQALPLLTQDSKDFQDLHDLVVAAGGHHPGMLVVRFDRDPRHNLSHRGIASAIAKLESSGVPIPDQIHVLNQWR